MKDFFWGRMRGFEPPTLGTTIRCSNQLSYNLRIGSANITSIFRENASYIYFFIKELFFIAKPDFIPLVK